ncbi:MAG: hypothetical protein GX927_00645 [Lentisphaerae bacterium]|nr:hypothetical protein [Lentisphaerota bacterium]
MKTFPMLVCPAESMNFGDYNKGYFTYTHYARNATCGNYQARNSDKDYVRREQPMKQIREMSKPSIAIFFADNNNKANHTFSWWGAHQRYCGRHNGGVLENPGSTGLAKYRNGAGNLSFGDGHVESISNIEVVMPSDDIKLQGFNIDASAGF